jgi:preprotein translocase SecE subunit
VADEQSTKQKRRIRKVSESVREQAAKSAEQATTPSRKSLVWRGFTTPVRWVGKGFKKLGHATPFRQIGHGFARVGRTKVMRFIAKILLLGYFANSWRELRQVTWPNGRESRQLTSAVVIFAIVFGVVVALVDFGLDKLTKQVLLK